MGEFVQFLQRQGVHVGAQGDRWPFPEAKRGKHAGAGQALVDLRDAELAQLFNDEGRGGVFLKRGFRAPVQAVAPLSYFFQFCCRKHNAILCQLAGPPPESQVHRQRLRGRLFACPRHGAGRP